MSAASKKTTELTIRVSSNFLSVSFRKVYFYTTSLFFFDLQKTMKTLTFKRKSLSRKQKENNSFVSSSQKFVKCLIEGYNQEFSSACLQANFSCMLSKKCLLHFFLTFFEQIN